MIDQNVARDNSSQKLCGLSHLAGRPPCDRAGWVRLRRPLAGACATHGELCPVITPLALHFSRTFPVVRTASGRPCTTPCPATAEPRYTTCPACRARLEQLR